ncbi:MAG TPA: mechanosensitive ion channel domain-containing protein [Gaiellaceae bacterium]
MDSDWLRRALIAGAVLVIAIVVARLVDRAIGRRIKHQPESLTRYRVLRRSIVATIVALGILSALLVIPEVRAVAGGILASSAVIGLVIGLSARSTLGNFIAGLLIAFTQPLRIGDEVEVDDQTGRVREITLTYTLLETAAGARLYIPNEKLASDTIKNSTIAQREHLAQVDVPVPMAADLDRVIAVLQEEAETVEGAVDDRKPEAIVTKLESEHAIVTLAAWAEPGEVGAVESALRQAALRRLRSEGVF